MKAIVLTLTLLMISCATYDYDSPEYQQVWQATQKVLKRHQFIVRKSLYREGTLIATSRVSGDFLNKSRVKVVARVIANQEGYPDPVIRVVNQWDNSEVTTWGHPDYQARRQWINLSSNAAIEARLYNEIQQEMGLANPYSGRAWQPPKSLRNKYGKNAGVVPSVEIIEPPLPERPPEEPSLQEKSLEEIW